MQPTKAAMNQSILFGSTENLKLHRLQTADLEETLVRK